MADCVSHMCAQASLDTALYGPGAQVAPVLNTLWVDGALSWLEQACLSSARRMGHRVVLWTYGSVTGVPEGVDVEDAATVMPATSLVKHKKKNNWGVGADLFRYRLQRLGKGPWVDADCYFVRPLVYDPRRMLCGLSKPGLVTNSVLYFPADDPFLDRLEAHLGQKHIVPWWLPEWKKLPYRIRKALDLKPVPLERHIWGLTGPQVMTLTADELGRTSEVMPVDVFSPYRGKHARMALDPAADIWSLLTERTVCVHLYNGVLQDAKGAPPPKGSFARQICEREGIEF